MDLRGIYKHQPLVVFELLISGMSSLSGSKFRADRFLAAIYAARSRLAAFLLNIYTNWLRNVDLSPRSAVAHLDAGRTEPPSFST